jgi:hypothetical protein
MISVESFVFDILASILLFGLLLGFHFITQGFFSFVFDLSHYGFDFFVQLHENPNSIIVYLMPIVLHLLLSGGCIFFRGLINENFDILEVLLITAIPILIYLVYDSGDYLMSLLNNPRQTSKTPEDIFSYHISFIQVFTNILVFYFFNTLILFVGGYIGWLVFKYFGR